MRSNFVAGAVNRDFSSRGKSHEKADLVGWRVSEWTLVRRSCATLLWNTLAGHSCASRNLYI